MIELIEKKRAQLFEVCRRYHVKKLELFGSAADGTFDPVRSDIDFLLEFLPEAATNCFFGYFDLKESLEQLLERKVDLVMPSAIRNPYFRKEIDRQRQVLYAAQSTLYLWQTIQQYLPTLKQQAETILATFGPP